MWPGGHVKPTSRQDLDAIRLVGMEKMWIDHNTFYKGEDGLIDVSRGSSKIFISNNWFKNHNKVILLGHDDKCVEDHRMRVIIVYNHFGPFCHQRMLGSGSGMCMLQATFTLGGTSTPLVEA